MSWLRHECVVCGEPVTSLRATLCHCDIYEPIDDITDEP